MVNMNLLKHWKENCNELLSILFASSKSQSLIVPLAAPAATRTSEESKLTESIPLVCPDKLCIWSSECKIKRNGGGKVDNMYNLADKWPSPLVN